MLFWILYSMFIAMFYASMIKASLTIPSVYKPITSLREVVESGLEYTLFTDPVEEESWKESPDPLIRFLLFFYKPEYKVLTHLALVSKFF